MVCRSILLKRDLLWPIKWWLTIQNNFYDPEVHCCFTFNPHVQFTSQEGLINHFSPHETSAREHFTHSKYQDKAKCMYKIMFYTLHILIRFTQPPQCFNAGYQFSQQLAITWVVVVAIIIIIITVAFRT